MNTTIFKAATIVLALSAAAWAWAWAVEVKFEPVAVNVYVHVGDIEGRTYENEALNANIGLVVTFAGALRIDSCASFQSAQQISNAVKKVTPQPIRWVIHTGGQDLRWLGNGCFKAQGAEIIAYADAEADMKALGPEHLRSNAPVLKEKMDGIEMTSPTRWVKDANAKLALGGTLIEVVHRKGGHTPGNSIVWLSQSGVVFTGDLIYVDRILGFHPVTNTKTWVESFEARKALKPMVVPGHGSVTTLAKAQADTGNLLRALRVDMGHAGAAGTGHEHGDQEL